MQIEMQKNTQKHDARKRYNKSFECEHDLYMKPPLRFMMKTFQLI